MRDRPSLRLRARRLAGAFRRMMPVSSARLAGVETELSDHREEVSRLEGLLSDSQVDPDRNLTGVGRSSLYRSLSGIATSRDFSDTDRDRITDTAHRAYALRGEVETIIDLHLDFMLGDDLKPIADKKAKGRKGLQDHLDEVWKDPRNSLDSEHDEYSLSMILEGELLLGAELFEADGHLELEWLDPKRIKRVVKNGSGRDVFVILTSPDPNREIKLFVMDSLDERVEIEKVSAGAYRIHETTLNDDAQEETRTANVGGLCFFWPWGRLKGGRRGRSEAASIIDRADAYDELVWSTVDTANLQRMFLGVLTDPGIKKKGDAQEKLKELGLDVPPDYPRFIALNDKAKIELLSVKSSNAEAWVAKEIAIGLFGAKGFPEGWRGSQSDKGLAGARASDFVPLRRLRRKQRKLLKRWKRLLEVSLELRRRAGADIEKEAPFSIVTMEVGGKDKQRGAEVLKALSSAMVQAEAAGAVKPELLNFIFVAAVRELGLEVPPAMEGLPPKPEVDSDLDENLARGAGGGVADPDQVASQKSGTDEGNQDELDRERSSERRAS